MNFEMEGCKFEQLRFGRQVSYGTFHLWIDPIKGR